MSSESHSTTPGSSTPSLPDGLPCSFCTAATETAFALQCYPATAGTQPAGLDPDGGVVLCPTCSSEAVELLSAWTTHDRPQIDPAEPIGEGYRRTATDCSFCGDALDAAVAGVELYESSEDALPAYANYTLCADCCGVFGDFLCNVRADR